MAALDCTLSSRPSTVAGAPIHSGLQYSMRERTKDLQMVERAGEDSTGRARRSRARALLALAAIFLICGDQERLWVRVRPTIFTCTASSSCVPQKKTGGWGYGRAGGGSGCLWSVEGGVLAQVRGLPLSDRVG